MLIVFGRFFGTVQSARRVDAQHLIDVAVAPEREISHECHIRIGMVVLQILSLIIGFESRAVFRRASLFHDVAVGHRGQALHALSRALPFRVFAANFFQMPFDRQAVEICKAAVIARPVARHGDEVRFLIKFEFPVL